MTEQGVARATGAARHGVQIQNYNNFAATVMKRAGRGPSRRRIPQELLRACRELMEVAMKSIRCAFCIFLFLVCISLPAVAQDTASLTGTVRDSSGGVVAGAQVTVANSAIGLNRSVTTNNDGDYLFPAIPPGKLDLTISDTGFKTFVARGVVLRVSQNVRVNATLQVGEVAVKVEVSGESVGQVETQSSEIASTITGKEISQLELNGRNFTQLITLRSTMPRIATMPRS